MATTLSRLQAAAAVQAALDEFVRIGRKTFLARYGFGRSRDFLVKDPRSGQLCDSKAIVGAAYGYQFPSEGPLKAGDFSGGEATVEPKLRALGFEVVRIGEDWTKEEVNAAIEAYFEMLRLEAKQERFNKAAFNSDLRARLQSRSKSSVELKHHNISAVLDGMGLPFIDGYKPKGNAQLLLRKSVHEYVLQHADLIRQVVDALEDVRPPAKHTYKAVLVSPPELEVIRATAKGAPAPRLPRKVDYAARDETNRRLGRAGEEWAIGFEQQRLLSAGIPELFSKLEWVSETRGDGAGYDILSYDGPERHRYIEVKTTNGSHGTPFIISRNEVAFSQEAGEEFFLYRVFQFRNAPALYMLRGDVAKHVHLDPIDYRASFRRIAGDRL